jgi:hypothetical protein
MLPRYRQKAMRPFLDIGLPTWQYDPKFDIGPDKPTRRL